MSGVRLAMKSISDFLSIMEKMKNTSEDKKTITLPYSEFLELKNNSEKYKKSREEIYEELKSEYKSTINSLQDGYSKYYEKYCESRNENERLKVRIDTLESKIKTLKSRKWWRIWR